MKKCPYCAEEIQDAAIVCRYCGRDLPALSEPTPTISKPVQQTQKPKANKQPYPLVGVLLILLCCGSLFAARANQTSQATRSTPTPTPEKITTGANSVVFSTHTAEPSNTPRHTSTITHTATFTPSETPTVTVEPGTQTAIALNQAATQKSANSTSTAAIKAKNATATLVQASRRATGTARAKSDYATEVAQYTRINANELVTYPNNHLAELVVIRGRVFNIISNTDFQIWIDGLSREGVYISVANAYNDIFENDYVTIYGLVAGEVCGTNAFGGEICQPQIIGTFYEKK